MENHATVHVRINDVAKGTWGHCMPSDECNVTSGPFHLAHVLTSISGQVRLQSSQLATCK